MSVNYVAVTVRTIDVLPINQYIFNKNNCIHFRISFPPGISSKLNNEKTSISENLILCTTNIDLQINARKIWV